MKRALALLLSASLTLSLPPAAAEAVEPLRREAAPAPLLLAAPEN